MDMDEKSCSTCKNIYDCMPYSIHNDKDADTKLSKRECSPIPTDRRYNNEYERASDEELELRVEKSLNDKQIKEKMSYIIAGVLIIASYMIPIFLIAHYLYYAFTNPDLTLGTVLVLEFSKFWILYIVYIVIVILSIYTRRKTRRL